MPSVSVYKLKGRKNYYVEYRDPDTGEKIVKSTGESKKREADRVAGRIVKEIEDGSLVRGGNMRWSEFRDRYEETKLPSLADRTGDKVVGVFNVFERFSRPAKLSSVTSSLIAKHQQKMRNNGRSEQTIKSHTAHLMSALSWAKSQGWIHKLPEVDMPKRAKKSKSMKGRPITTEEFERMLDAVPKVVAIGHVKEDRKPGIVGSWRFLMRGLWLSGLRLDESMQLHWTDYSEFCVADLDSDAPVFFIQAETEKGNEDRTFAMSPEFAEFLRQVPQNQREGYVFNPLPRRARYGSRLSSHHVGRTICDIGKAAKVVVSGSKKDRIKYASAHDFRRAFGQRWASKVMPATLQEMMRHESIETTMRFYVEMQAKTTAATLWEHHRRLPADTYTFTHTQETESRKTT